MLTPAQFYDLTPYEFGRIKRGYYERQQEESANFRVLATVLANMFAKKPVEPQKLWSLPYVDELDSRPATSSDQMAGGLFLLALAKAYKGNKDKQIVHIESELMKAQAKKRAEMQQQQK